LLEVIFYYIYFIISVCLSCFTIIIIGSAETLSKRRNIDFALSHLPLQPIRFVVTK